uniref:Putative phosphoesterase n=1 Tax=Sphaerisporangium sp. SANK 60911 TaxID=1354075 RepID=V5YS18_9ACTN|nr:putative phosphoesterase [Sphaerisporangium sp. SANK 60911]
MNGAIRRRGAPGRTVNGGIRRWAGFAAMACAVALSVVAALVAARWPPLAEGDRAVARWSYHVGVDRPGLVGALRAWTAALAPRTWVLAGIAMALALLARRRVRAAAGVALATVAGTLVELTGKAVVERARPAVEYAIPGAGSWYGESFPSGHAIAATVGGGLLLWICVPFLGRRARTAAVAAGIAVIALTGWSRVALDAHWASDVVAGWLAGIVVLGVTVALSGPVRAYDTG